mmetsp:Transcript_4022/g.11768  ORF Transcript_4022/g.11768 Transcript_4022/m.11768 type:complete len:80 (+) Transcript_4022:161-400(+)
MAEFLSKQDCHCKVKEPVAHASEEVPNHSLTMSDPKFHRWRARWARLCDSVFVCGCTNSSACQHPPKVTLELAAERSCQ